MDDSSSVDVVVVGGGLAGLQAAHLLHERGATVALLEASTRTGGRIRSHQSAHSHELVIERGGELVGRHHEAFRALCAEANVPLIEIDEGGGGILPEIVSCDGTALTGPAWQQLEHELDDFVEMVEELARRIDPHSPLRTRVGRELCDIAVEDWMLQRGVSQTLTRLFCDHAPRMQCATAMLALVAAAGDGSYFGGAESAVVEGGAGRIAEFMAHALGGVIRCGRRVDQIDQVGTGYIVSGQADGAVFRQHGTAVIIATPPPCWPTADRMPAHPPAMTANRKVMLELRDHRVATSAVSNGPCRLVWPSPQMQAYSGDITILSMLALPVGRAPAMSTSALAESAGALIGISPNKILASHETRWDQSPFSRGAYPVLGGRALRTITETMESEGGIVFAGDWTMPGWCGLMEGAVRSGQRAAYRILSFLMGSDALPSNPPACKARRCSNPLFGSMRGESPS